MGKLVEKLERLSRSSGPQLGFGAGTVKRELSIALAAVLPAPDAKLAQAAIEQGANALLVQELGRKKLQVSLAKALGVPEGTPCGAEIKRAPGADLSLWDFAILEAEDPVDAFLGADGLDRVLRLGPEVPDTLLRTLEALPVDAVALPGPTAALTVQDLTLFYRVAQATSKPIIALLSPGAERGALAALRDAGVVAIMTEIASAAQAEELARLRDVIDHLPPRKRRPGRTRPSISLGLTSGESASRADEEEDEGDEED